VVSVPCSADDDVTVRSPCLGRTLVSLCCQTQVLVDRVVSTLQQPLLTASEPHELCPSVPPAASFPAELRPDIHE